MGLGDDAGEGVARFGEGEGFLEINFVNALRAFLRGAIDFDFAIDGGRGEGWRDRSNRRGWRRG